MEIKQLNIILVISSFFVGCNRTKPDKKNEIELNFYYNGYIESVEEPLICKRSNKTFYFGVPNSKILKIDVSQLDSISIKKRGVVKLISKPLKILDSNFPKASSFFSISQDMVSMEGYLDSKNIFWFDISNNPMNNNDLILITEELLFSECSW